MKETKIYLVRGYSREPYDESHCLVDAFESRELAQKCADGWDDIDEALTALWEVKQAERDGKLASITYLLDEQYDEQANLIYDEYEKYEFHYSFIYSVQEIDLIN